MAPCSTSIKREISSDDDNTPSQSNKRIKKEEGTENQDNDRVETVESDEQRIVKLVKLDLDDDEQLAANSLEEFALLCLASSSRGEHQVKRNRSLVSRLGGCLAILRAITKHGGSPLVQANGCRALANASAHRASTETIASLGGIEVALAAMKRFPDLSNLQTFCCVFFHNLCLVKKLASKVVDHPDGISNMVHTMTSFPNETNIQKFGCMTLRKIIDHKIADANDLVIKCGGLVALAEAKTNHPDNEFVQNYASLAMKSLL